MESVTRKQPERRDAVWRDGRLRGFNLLAFGLYRKAGVESGQEGLCSRKENSKRF
jgi:hypothetical protein